MRLLPELHGNQGFCSASWSSGLFAALHYYCLSGPWWLFMKCFKVWIRLSNGWHSWLFYLWNSCWISVYLSHSFCLSTAEEPLQGSSLCCHKKFLCAGSEKHTSLRHEAEGGAKVLSQGSDKLYCKGHFHMHFRYLQYSGITRKESWSEHLIASAVGEILYA